MTWIRIDPNELGSTSATLRSTAVELSELIVQLRTCVQCPMPPDSEANIAKLVSMLDQVCDRMAVVLNSWATDLDNRATAAFIDLNTSSVIGGTTLAATVAAGAAGGFTIGGDGGFNAAVSTNYNPFPGSFTIGGDGGFNAAVSTNYNPFPGGFTIGGGSSSSSSPGDDASTILAKAAEKHRQNAIAIGNRILANPSTTDAERAFVYGTQLQTNENITRMLAPTKSDMENKLGYLLSNERYWELVPEARPPG